MFKTPCRGFQLLATLICSYIHDFPKPHFRPLSFSRIPYVFIPDQNSLRLSSTNFKDINSPVVSIPAADSA